MQIAQSSVIGNGGGVVVVVVCNDGLCPAFVCEEAAEVAVAVGGAMRVALPPPLSSDISCNVLSSVV